MSLKRIVLIALLSFPSIVLASDDDHGHGSHSHENSEHHADGDAHHGSDDDHVARVDGIEILHAWTQATESGEARVFMEISNESDGDVTLLGGDTGIGDRVTVRAMDYTGGAKPVDVGSFPIKAGSEVDLTPDGLFLEIAELDMHLEQGTSFEMHVEFDPIGEIEVVVEVEAKNASNHSHAGHNH